MNGIESFAAKGGSAVNFLKKLQQSNVRIEESAVCHAFLAFLLHSAFLAPISYEWKVQLSTYINN